jgi:hypothetical protein
MAIVPKLFALDAKVIADGSALAANAIGFSP